jgi:UDP-4-amino-4,6-dideoxy-N-acetyl-beta-L-altrosamine transaminase
MNQMSPVRRLPYGRQSIEPDDIDAVVAALKGDYLTTGPLVPAFENALSQTVGAGDAIAVSNCTAALHLAARAAGLTEGTWTIVPSITFLATANAVRLNGGEVAFADVDPATGVMTAETLQAAIARAPGPVKAAIPVHFAGPSADMPALSEVASKYGMTLIEDAAHAIGTQTPFGAAGAGRHSAMTCFSFHPVKTITTGEGGAITTNDSRLARALRRDRSHGMTRDQGDFLDHDLSIDGAGQANPWSYEMHGPGLNYRMTDFQAALGISQLRKLDRFTAARAAIKAVYDEIFSGYAPLIETPKSASGQSPAWHLYPLRIDFQRIGKERANVMRKLAAEGIGTQVHYTPVDRQPYYRERYGRSTLLGAQEFYSKTLSLPLFADMAKHDAENCAARLISALDL